MLVEVGLSAGGNTVLCRVTIVERLFQQEKVSNLYIFEFPVNQGILVVCFFMSADNCSAN